MNKPHQEEANEETPGPEPFVFRLYVTGASPNSIRAISNIKKIFSKHLHKGYELEIIDVYQQPAIAKQDNIIALPLLVKKSPLPERRLIGDMSDMEKVLYNIGLQNDTEL
jgi:circadian clock protein KaiB